MEAAGIPENLKRVHNSVCLERLENYGITISQPTPRYGAWEGMSGSSNWLGIEYSVEISSSRYDLVNTVVWLDCADADVMYISNSRFDPAYNPMGCNLKQGKSGITLKFKFSPKTIKQEYKIIFLLQAKFDHKLRTGWHEHSITFINPFDPRPPAGEYADPRWLPMPRQEAVIKDIYDNKIARMGVSSSVEFYCTTSGPGSGKTALLWQLGFWLQQKPRPRWSLIHDVNSNNRFTVQPRDFRRSEGLIFYITQPKSGSSSLWYELDEAIKNAYNTGKPQGMSELAVPNGTLYKKDPDVGHMKFWINSFGPALADIWETEKQRRLIFILDIGYIASGEPLVHVKRYFSNFSNVLPKSSMMVIFALSSPEIVTEGIAPLTDRSLCFSEPGINSLLRSKLPRDYVICWDGPLISQVQQLSGGNPAATAWILRVWWGKKEAEAKEREAKEREKRDQRGVKNKEEKQEKTESEETLYSQGFWALVDMVKASKETDLRKHFEDWLIQVACDLMEPQQLSRHQLHLVPMFRALADAVKENLDRKGKQSTSEPSANIINCLTVEERVWRQHCGTTLQDSFCMDCKAFMIRIGCVKVFDERYTLSVPALCLVSHDDKRD